MLLRPGPENEGTFMASTEDRVEERGTPQLMPLVAFLKDESGYICKDMVTSVFMRVVELELEAESVESGNFEDLESI